MFTELSDTTVRFMEAVKELVNEKEGSPREYLNGMAALYACMICGFTDGGECISELQENGPKDNFDIAMKLIRIHHNHVNKAMEESRAKEKNV